MKKKFSVVIALALMLSMLVVPTYADDEGSADIILLQGESTEYAVSWNESSVIFTPGSQPITVRTTDASVAGVSMTGMSVGSYSTIRYQITGMNPGKATLLFYHTSSGQLLQACTVQVKEAKSISVNATPQNYGSVSVLERAAAGDTVKFEITPVKGCEVDSVTAKTVSNEEIELTEVEAKKAYSFTMPEDNVTISVTYKGNPELQIQVDCEAEKGKVTLEKEIAKPGEKVTFKADAKEGNKIESIQIMTVDNDEVKCNESGDGYVFEMPEKPVTIHVRFSHKVIVNTVEGKGTADVSNRYPKTGETVTFTMKPDPGYELKYVTGNLEDGSEFIFNSIKYAVSFSFEMPDQDVSINIQFKKSDHVFDDVKDGEWYSAAVSYVVEKGYMAGTDKKVFSPNMSVSRAMVAQILYAMEGKPGYAGASSFDDTATKDWFYDAVNWAAKNDLVAGYGNRRFGPNNAVTREQLAAIMNKYTQFKRYTSAAKADLSQFNDRGQISKWATESMQWAVGNKLLSGVGNRTLQPKGTATRAQLAVILKAYDENIRK